MAVEVEKVNHFFGDGEFRNQVLFDNNIDIPAGQLVIMTGPSGSGKTTLLTLIGALRSVQSGRIAVLDHDLSGLQRSNSLPCAETSGLSSRCTTCSIR